jgi:hypothetical protein
MREVFSDFPTRFSAVPTGPGETVRDKPRLFDKHLFAENLFDSRKDRVTVKRSERHGFQNQEIQRAGKKFSFVTHTFS